MLCTAWEGRRLHLAPPPVFNHAKCKIPPASLPETSRVPHLAWSPGMHRALVLVSTPFLSLPPITPLHLPHLVLVLPNIHRLLVLVLQLHLLLLSSRLLLVLCQLFRKRCPHLGVALSQARRTQLPPQLGLTVMTWQPVSALHIKEVSFTQRDHTARRKRATQGATASAHPSTRQLCRF